MAKGKKGIEGGGVGEKPSYFRGPNQGEYANTPSREALQREALEEAQPFIVHDEVIEPILDSIDFNGLKAIFDRDMRKGVRPVPESSAPSAHVIPRAHIVLTNTEGMAALNGPTDDTMAYMPTGDLILANSDIINAAIRRHPRIPPPLLILKILAHEENHAVSSHFSTDPDFSSDEEKSVQIQIGVHQMDIRPGGELLHAYRLLNEAINEKRAVQVAAEYARSHPLPGVTHEDIDRLADEYVDTDVNAEYLAGMHAVNVIISAVAKDTGVSEDKVWEGLMHAELNGLDFNSRDAKIELDLDSLFGRGFTASLANLDIKSAILFAQSRPINTSDKFYLAMKEKVKQATWK